MNSPARKSVVRVPDPTHYPVEETMGEDSLQMLILELLRPLVERWLAHVGKPAFVGSDQFIYWEQFHPEKVVAPDLYVLPGVRPGRPVKSWKVWKSGIVPKFALEVVTSHRTKKDYLRGPERYDELGVDELCIFDAEHETSEDRVRWQRFRRLKSRGLVRVESTNEDRIRSRTLGCYLRAIGKGEDLRVRLGTGPNGDDLFPTEVEAERAAKEAERAEKEAALVAKEAVRAEKEAVRAEKDAVLRELEELKALLAKGST